MNFQDYILMIHEDHVPLENVDSRLMSKITEAAKKNKWKFIHLCELREKYLSKKGKRISEILNAEIFIIRDDYCWRSSSDPVIVEVDYLKSLTNQAIKEGLKSPWEFELMRESDQNHYVVDRKNSDKFIWPIVWSGFLIRGAVNGAAINRMNHPSLGSLKKMLVKDYLL